MPRLENKDLLGSSRPEVKPHDLHTTKHYRRNNAHQHRFSISARLEKICTVQSQIPNL